MATAKQIDNAFLTEEVKNNIAIEKSTKKNLDRINEKNIREIHKNILEVFEMKNKDDSKYFEFDIFSNLVKEYKKQKKINEEYKIYKDKNSENALSKSDWLKEYKENKNKSN